jgi:tRNA pseudouridine32 synthase/23S rRNA pseudouridine746 synthase
VSEYSVLFRDHHLIALDKPSGLLAVPGRGPEKFDSLATRVQADYPSATVVHRLDQETSGVMVMALRAAAHRHLQQQFEQRRTEKLYIAVVAGVVAEDAGEINLPLANMFENPPRHVVEFERGREATTHWRVIERYADRTRLELRPLTGRSHQLRVHLSHVGHPILGDSLYAPPEVRALAARLMLHAEELSIEHPTTGAMLLLRSDCPF